MAAEARVDVSKALGALRAFGVRADTAVLDALDEVARVVANHAKTGHPKATQGGGNKDGERELTGPEAGEYAGDYRFLTDTGVLRNSIKIERAQRVGTVMRAKVFSAVEYANKVEFGDVTSRPFPFMRPALEAAAPEGRKLIAEAIRRAMEGR